MANMVKYHNDLNLMQFTGFGEKEIDTFFAICFKLKNQGDREVEMTYSELKDLINVGNRSDERIHNVVENVLNNLIRLRLKYEDDAVIILISIFSKIVIKKEERVFSIKISEDFAYLLNDFLKNYTIFDLEEITKLKSGYSKNAYRTLKQFKSTGWCEISLEKFRFIMNVPESYDISRMTERILKPITKELKDIFPDLKIKKIKRGREVIRLKFTWKVTEPKEVKQEEPEMDELEKKLQMRLFEKIEKEREQERSGKIWL